jgi:hypothetical protein
MECPDAIGWSWSGFSTIVECKVSLEDYYADRQKPFRRYASNGMGAWRYYMTPAGLLEPSKVCQRWGLLEVHPKQVRTIKKAETQVYNPTAELSLVMSAMGNQHVFFPENYDKLQMVNVTGENENDPR